MSLNRTSPRLVLLALITFSFGGCASTDGSDTDGDGGGEILIIDEQTAVVPAGVDIYWDRGTGPTPFAPDDEDVATVLAAIDDAPELAWATEHTIFLHGVDDDGEAIIRARFSCNSEPLVDPSQALEQLRRVELTDGGGECYGFATFTTAGSLVDYDVNGGS